MRCNRFRSKVYTSLPIIFVTMLSAMMPAALRATTLIKMSLATLSQTAKHIARVRCVSSTTTLDSGEIWTLTIFEVQQNWRGFLPTEVTVRLLGGTLGNITSTVSGVPRFQPGEEAVLFLEANHRGEFSIVSWQQGTFRIRRSLAGDESVTQGTASFPAFDPATRHFESGGIVNMSVASFRSQVESALTVTAGRKS